MTAVYLQMSRCQAPCVKSHNHRLDYAGGFWRIRAPECPQSDGHGLRKRHVLIGGGDPRDMVWQMRDAILSDALCVQRAEPSVDTSWCQKCREHDAMRGKGV